MRIDKVKRLSIISLENYLIEILFYAYVVAATLQRIFGYFDYFEMLYIASVTGLIIFLLELRSITKKYLLLYVIAYIMALGILMEFFIVSALGGGNTLVFLFSNIGIASFLLRRKLQLIGVPIIFWIFTSYFFYHILVGTISDETILAHSRNHISVTMLFITVLYYFWLLKNNKTLSLIPAFCFLVICVWAIGRSGIIASTVLFTGLTLFGEKNKLNLTVAGIVGVAVILYFTNWETRFIFNYDPLIQFYTKSIGEEARIDIILRYFSSLDVKSFFLGYGRTYYSEFMIGGNLHNSFLNAHFRFGISAFFLFIIILIALIKAVLVENKVYFVLLLAILLRAFTDTILIPSYYDFTLYFLLVRILIDCKVKLTGFKWLKRTYRI